MYGVPPVPEEPKQAVTAVPSRQEFEAKMAQYAPAGDNPLVSKMQRTVEDLEWDDPNRSESYEEMMQNLAAQEMWNSKEQARRKAQTDLAWEQYDREKEAARQRDIREYEDKDPSWGYSMMEQPFVRNTIGVRRYNPYTGEMEWHYPRNAAEGVSTGITSLLNLAYGSVAGLAGHPYAGQQLVDRNRKIQENQFYAPYALDNAMKAAVVSGHGPEIPATLADKMSASIAEKELLRDLGSRWNEQDAQSARETMKKDYDYILANFGQKAADNYLLGKFGTTKNASQSAYEGAVSLYEMAKQSGLPADLELAKQSIQTAVLAETDPVKRANLISMAKGLNNAAYWADENKVPPAPPQAKPEKRREDLLISEMLKDGVLDDNEYAALMSDPTIGAELRNIVENTQALPEAARGAAIQAAVRGSNPVKNLTRNWSDLPITIGAVISPFSRDFNMLRRKLHKTWPWIPLDEGNVLDRKLMLQEALVNKLTKEQPSSMPSVPSSAQPKENAEYYKWAQPKAQPSAPVSAVDTYNATVDEELAKMFTDSLSKTYTSPYV